MGETGDAEKVLLDGLDEGVAPNVRLMEDEEQINEYIKKLQEQLLAQQTAAAQGPGIAIHPAIFIIAFIILFSVVGFFSYKLIKSLSEKERKKEQKKRLKELKKKK